MRLSLLLPVHDDIFSFMGKTLTSYKHMFNSARDHLARTEQAELVLLLSTLTIVLHLKDSCQSNEQTYYKHDSYGFK